MNQKILCIGLLALFLLTCGCGERNNTAADDTIEEAITPADKNIDTPDTTDVPASAAGDLTEDTASNASEEVGSISQEDLDELKADLEGMEFDDVGGLSE